ncbi:hypothetical protein Dda_2129 [Drechslerella dactyloides]|uniref:Xaa-Pro aminopeptidase n=1 Tax=Drechslerella dactyloides TaxID=74499 RepID=A0AAD6J5B2_DREDA|nr:hypothetical protein Dda_2129 [Drechslerella dactyloides]
MPCVRFELEVANLRGFSRVAGGFWRSGGGRYGGILIAEVPAAAAAMKTNALFPLLGFSFAALSSAMHISLNIQRPSAEVQTLNKYPAKLHARRVAQALNLTQGLVYLSGEVSRLIEDSDMPAFFRQKRYFYYLTGLDYPDAHVTYDLELDKLTLWILRPDPKEKLWRANDRSGPSPTPKSLVITHDIDIANYSEDLPSAIAAYAVANPSAKVHVIHDYYPPAAKDPVPKSTFDNTKLQYAMDVCRVVKDPYEVAMIRRANDISTKAHLRVMSEIDQLTSERDIEALFIAESIKRGGLLAYDTIAPSGRNCSILHYVNNDQLLAGKQLVLLDAGAEYELYASDVTRTFPISGRFTPEAAQIYQLVRDMQEAVFAMVKPGVKWRDCNLRAADVAAEGLIRLGVLVGDAKEIIKSRLIGGVFFPHGLGHHVGLETHDVLYGELISDKRRARMARRSSVMTRDDFEAYTASETHNRLTPGMTLTVEPGVYFNQPLYEDFMTQFPNASKYVNEDVLAKYWDVGGVRIEDCILVTANGFENLTKAPKEMQEVEKMVRMGKANSK